jgi:anaerobic magnesium-protoporphyrin IX monomethyl ester cyclase
MFDILLVYPPYISKYKNAPLGLGYLASVAEKNGFTVKIVDMDPSGITLSDLNNLIKKNAPKLVGISFMTNQFSNALSVAKIVKHANAEISIIVGGNHVSAIPEEIIRYDFIDFAVVGEGEVTFQQFIEILSKGNNNWQDIDGLIFKRNGNIITNKKRDLIQDLDTIPFPKWDDFPYQVYSEKIIGVLEELPVFSVLTSRGCPGKCSFCSSHVVFTRRYRERSANNIFQELQFLEEKFGARHFNFVDDTLTINKKRIEELCDLLIKSNKKIRWIANARVNNVNPELLQKMYQAGCRNICFGVESGDPVVRENIGKRISEEQIKNAHAWAKKAGLIVTSFFMVGNLGETWQSIEKTIALAKELKSDYPTCSIATPYPGTRFMEEAEKHNWIITKNWDEYITSPHLNQKYSPVSSNGLMSAEDILRGYYKINAAFSKIKLITRYGEWYLLNNEFYIKEVIKRIVNQGFKHTFKLGFNLLKGKISNSTNS